MIHQQNSVRFGHLNLDAYLLRHDITDCQPWFTEQFVGGTVSINTKLLAVHFTMWIWAIHCLSIENAGSHPRDAPSAEQGRRADFCDRPLAQVRFGWDYANIGITGFWFWERYIYCTRLYLYYPLWVMYLYRHLYRCIIDGKGWLE